MESEIIKMKYIEEYRELKEIENKELIMIDNGYIIENKKEENMQEKIIHLLNSTEKNVKKYIDKKYKSEFKDVQLYKHRTDFLDNHQYIKNEIKTDYSKNSLEDNIETIKDLLYLRFYGLKDEIALNKIISKRNTNIYENEISFKEIKKELYSSISILFTQILNYYNSEMYTEENLDLLFLDKDSFLKMIFSQMTRFNEKSIENLIESIKEFELNCQEQEEIEQKENIEDDIRNDDIKNDVVKQEEVVKSFAFNQDSIDKEITKKTFPREKLENDLEINHPNRIQMPAFDDKIIERILKHVVSSEQKIINDIINETEEDTVDVKRMKKIKKMFLKSSELLVDIHNFEYKFEDEKSFLKELRISFDIRYKYLRYKTLGVKYEALYDEYDREKSYLESIFNKVQCILSKLIYCAINMFNEANPNESIDIEKFIESEDFINFLGDRRHRKIQSLEEFKNMYDENLKRNIIRNHLEKNPADEYPEARKIKRKFIIHSGQTNSGKTYGAIEDLKLAKKGTYLGPLRLLAIEIQETLLNIGIKCDLLTGEEELSFNDSTHISSTVEKANFKEKFEVAVIDECQMINDEDRGGSWTNAILGIKADIIHLCTAPSCVKLLTKLIESCNDEYEIINHKRNTKLVMDERVFKDFDDCEKGDALIVFSKRNVLSVASALLNRGIKSSIIYGALPYKTRKLQMERFLNGETDVVVSTDAIGLGVNLPIQRVIFIDSMKYDGNKKRKLYPEEVKQISGRAGRYGMYDIGYVNALENYEDIKYKIEMPYFNIEKAKLRLPESISEIEGDLSDNIRLWKDIDNLDSFEKCSVDRELMMLKILDNLGYSDIGNTYKYKLATMYFSEKDEGTFNLWKKYLNIYFRDLEDVIPKPNIDDYKSNLQGLESYYKSIELYYSFSKTFALEMDLEWIRNEKLTISEKINNILISEIKGYQKKCKCCGKELRWDTLDAVCTRCSLISAFNKGDSSIRIKIG